MSVSRIAALAALAMFSAVAARPAEEIVQAPSPPAVNPELLSSRWAARWIAPPDVSLTDYGVFHFRKHLELTKVPARFVVHVSADNRYRLWVNGTPVTYGPQRGDRMRWHFDSLDLAPYLRAGRNVLAIQVWNFGEDRPYALMSVRTGLIVQGDGSGEQAVNTPDGWLVRVQPSGYSPLPAGMERLKTFIVVGPGERLDAAAYPWDWEQLDFDDAGWKPARVLGPGTPAGHGTDFVHWLAPRTLPLMEERLQAFQSVRRTWGDPPGAGFLAGREGWVVPRQTSVRMLLDQGHLTNAFPVLRVSDGAGARVTLAYAEALVDQQGAKGDRDETEDRELIGVEDEFLPDGGLHRVFTTLDFRTYRYVELRIETGMSSLTVEGINGVATGYPFVEIGSFSSDDPSLDRIWEVGWRTAALCAGETYFDCPYYERLQYVGDTRIQALLSLYVPGDDRLVRNAIELFDRSRIPEGLTQSRYPSHTPQIINTFSLLWIGMVHDYAMHRDDPAFTAGRLRGVEGVLDWFEDRVDARTGMLGPLPYWTFVDWPEEWAWDPKTESGGEAPGARTGGSSIVTLQYAMALGQAATLFHGADRGDFAVRCAQQAAALREATRRACWDEERQLLADTPEKKSFSQHANALFVLSGAIEGESARDLITRTIDDASLTQCTLYFRFYLLRALKKAGLGDQYLARLGPWHDMLALNLSTFAERPEPTRSDCHAWSASPLYEFLATVCGIEPGSVGFKTIRIEPHLGPLMHVTGTVPHPAGLIQVNITRDASGEGARAQVKLPHGVTGEFIWRGSSRALRGGAQDLDF